MSNAQNINMRIENIANVKGDITYEIVVIGSESDIEGFTDFTSYTADFIEEQQFGEYSVNIMGTYEFSKKEFRAAVAKELKEYKKIK